MIWDHRALEQVIGSAVLGRTRTKFKMADNTIGKRKRSKAFYVGQKKKVCTFIRLEVQPKCTLYININVRPFFVYIL